MKKFLIRLVGWILCLAVIAGGAYLSYLTSDFDEFEADMNVIITHFQSMGDMFGGSTNPDDTETNPDGGETNPDGGDTNTDGGDANTDGGDTNTDGGDTNPDEGGNT